MNLPSGWSMISLPLMPKNASVLSLYPGAVVMYGYQKGIGYVHVKEGYNPEAGKGYWILLNEAKTFSITGAIIDGYNLSVQDGWYMIGGCTSSAKASGDNCNIAVIYSYEQGFGYKPVQRGEDLKAGKGYWILIKDASDQACLTVQGMF
jgi:hypothetical protein